jgi:hypothetical protein
MVDDLIKHARSFHPRTSERDDVNQVVDELARDLMIGG